MLIGAVINTGGRCFKMVNRIRRSGALTLLLSGMLLTSLLIPLLAQAAEPRVMLPCAGAHHDGYDK